MKVGILVECGRQGLEDVLCRRICELLRAETGVDFEIDIVPMDNKRNLIQNCGTATASLFASDCDRVVVLWDERPAWPTKGERLCWHNDRQDILANLRQAQAPDRQVYLVCIEREFESWLLFDERMLNSVLSTDAHRAGIKKQKAPDRLKDPKAKMKKLFQEHRGWDYGIQHAARIARCLQNLAKLRHCETFRRFAEKVTGTRI